MTFIYKQNGKHFVTIPCLNICFNIIISKVHSKLDLPRVNVILQIFNKRFKCNTECRKMENGTAEKLQCEKDFCQGFVKPKTKEQQEEEELKKLAEQYDYDYSYDDEEEEDS